MSAITPLRRKLLHVSQLGLKPRRLLLTSLGLSRSLSGAMMWPKLSKGETRTLHTLNNHCRATNSRRTVPPRATCPNKTRANHTVARLAVDKPCVETFKSALKRADKSALGVDRPYLLHLSSGQHSRRKGWCKRDGTIPNALLCVMRLVCVCSGGQRAAKKLKV